MSHEVIGVDLGAHSVKIVTLEVGFRALTVTGYQSVRVRGPSPANPTDLTALLDGSVEALRDQADADRDPTSVICVGLPGDFALVRQFEIPISDARALEAVVTNELTDDIPWEPEDVVCDHLLAHGAGRIIAGASRRETVQRLLERLQEVDWHARQLSLATFGYAALVDRVLPGETVLVADLGHVRTNLCLICEGQVVMGRTLSTGGAHVTQALARHFNISLEQAEALKVTRATVGLPARSTAESAPSADLERVTTAALQGLVKEIAHSLELFHGKARIAPQRVLLCGGTARLPGIDRHLEAALGVPVEPFPLDTEHSPLGELPIPPDEICLAPLALGLALQFGQRKRIDFRKGEFAFKPPTTLLREKVRVITLAAAALLISVALSAYASLNSLGKESDQLLADLQQASRLVLGEPLTNPKDVSRRMKRGTRKKGASIPSTTAFDILQRVAERVPQAPGSKAAVDINRLEIKPGKTYIRGTADSRGTVGKLIEELKREDCFKDVSSGRISEVADDKKQFSLTVATACF